MHFATFTLAALSAASLAVADVVVHVVKVSGTTNTLTYAPNNVTAAVGDMVQFQFGVGNHTVTQSTFDAPCVPVSTNGVFTGVFSGFMPVAVGAATVPTYTILINNTTPIWVYCSQAAHCQKGMNMVINENTAKNATRSLANYMGLAAKAAANLAPTSADGGSAATSASGASGTASSTGSSTSSGSTAKASSAAAPFKIPVMGGLLAVGAAILL